MCMPCFAKDLQEVAGCSMLSKFSGDLGWSAQNILNPRKAYEVNGLLSPRLSSMLCCCCHLGLKSAAQRVQKLCRPQYSAAMQTAFRAAVNA